ncbi:HesA/MoeB/ThiF family protein [Pacificoceanicola onchidii]|uniref:HesA/MoeB/ThiF family protein n=1 Tax=Pacificoceanicola onchidii TaxID=2562685 RepID=UPI0010A32705|nr:HesA/MoeB/ThiF family protein [Pacificoceanicola onchidii]
MLLVVGVMAGLWGMGHLMGAPVRARLIMIGFVYVGVVLATLVLPEGNELRDRLGGGPEGWLILGGMLALGFAYAGVVRRLKAASSKRAGDSEPAKAGAFADGELSRYARHIVLRELGGPGQKKLKEANVLVVGAGGLGSPALLYLAAAGVGTIGVIDDDEVDSGNLQRQVIHDDPSIGKPKVFSARDRMLAINPFIEVRPYKRKLTEDIAADLLGDYDLVLDGTDNFDTRYLVNKVAAAQDKPLVSGALSQWEGQVSVFDPATSGPCYQCIFPEAPAPELAPSCAEAGVLGPLPGVVGSMMAVEAVKVITGAGQALRGEMLIYDALWGETRKITLKARADCPVCGDQAPDV